MTEIKIGDQVQITNTGYPICKSVRFWNSKRFAKCANYGHTFNLRDDRWIRVKDT